MTEEIRERVIKVELRTTQLEADVEELRKLLWELFSSLDRKLTWTVGLLFSLLMAVIANGILS
ncbi:MAG: hypothetical protein D6746_04595 [Bacteroidetes bacterium]|nr:MAG: hypothetical protein D6746_04595 [Bacteroidota bacterium]